MKLKHGGWVSVSEGGRRQSIKVRRVRDPGSCGPYKDFYLDSKSNRLPGKCFNKENFH